MATRKDNTENLAQVEEDSAKLEKRVKNLEAYVRKLHKRLEQIFGLDIDGDGKVGSVKIGILAFLSLAFITFTALGAEDVLWRGYAQEGNDAVIQIDADEGDDAADTLELIMKADGTGSIDIGGSQALSLSAGGFGATGAASASVVEYGPSAVMKTVITLNSTLTATDGSAEGETAKIYTFPEGRIYILGAAIDATIVNTATEAEANDTFVVAIGSVAAADDATLTSTEADIIAGPTLDDGAVTLTNQWEADMTAGADSVFDGTATAASLNLNLGIADANITTNDFSATFTGTLSVYWINLGDD